MGTKPTQIDQRLVDLCRLGPRRLALPTLLYLIAWTCEAAETSLLLSLLGVKLDIGTFCLIEVCAATMRHVFFVAPAGIGVQDLSYAALLHVFGVPGWLGVAAAFTVLKRSKEVLWSLVGYGLIATMPRWSRASADATATGETQYTSPARLSPEERAAVPAVAA